MKKRERERERERELGDGDAVREWDPTMPTS
jgi:hypothetical protein